MQKKEIYIVSGSIQSGKSTGLLKWSQRRNDVYGILSPDHEGRRIFMDVSTGEKFPMEADPDEISTIPIGKFIFSMKSFSRAIEIISTGSTNKKGWLVIDEIGPLEIAGKGFDEILNEILQSKTSDLKIILVIREKLKNEVIEKYQLNSHLTKEFNFPNDKDALV